MNDGFRVDTRRAVDLMRIDENHFVCFADTFWAQLSFRWLFTEACLIRWEDGPGWKHCCCRPGCVTVTHVCACVLRGRVSGVMRV